MTELEFKALANQGYNRIPLIVEAIADLDTPLSLYLKLTRHNHDGKNNPQYETKLFANASSLLPD